MRGRTRTRSDTLVFDCQLCWLNNDWVTKAKKCRKEGGGGVKLVPGRFRLGGEVVGPPAATVPLSCGKVEEGGELVPGRPEVRAKVSPLHIVAICDCSATFGLS